MGSPKINKSGWNINKAVSTKDQQGHTDQKCCKD